MLIIVGYFTKVPTLTHPDLHYLYLYTSKLLDNPYLILYSKLLEK